MSTCTDGVLHPTSGIEVMEVAPAEEGLLAQFEGWFSSVSLSRVSVSTRSCDELALTALHSTVIRHSHTSTCTQSAEHASPLSQLALVVHVVPPRVTCASSATPVDPSRALHIIGAVGVRCLGASEAQHTELLERPADKHARLRCELYSARCTGEQMLAWVPSRRLRCNCSRGRCTNGRCHGLKLLSCKADCVGSLWPSHVWWIDDCWPLCAWTCPSRRLCRCRPRCSRWRRISRSACGC